MAQYYLSLNQAALLFFPAESEPHVVQVVINTLRKPTVGVLATFFLAQGEITRIVESLVGAHISFSAALPPIQTPVDITLKGKDYRIIGRREEWKYGKGLKLAWGEKKIKSSEYKWVFEFHADCC